MKPKSTFVVLTASGSSWQPHGPLAEEYRSVKEAEAAAHELSARYPQRVLGVYELRSVFGTEQKIVKQNVETHAEPPKRRIALPGDNLAAIRAVN
jgi:hypothetical protein